KGGLERRNHRIPHKPAILDLWSRVITAIFAVNCFADMTCASLGERASVAVVVKAHLGRLWGLDALALLCVDGDHFVCADLRTKMSMSPRNANATRVYGDGPAQWRDREQGSALT